MAKNPEAWPKVGQSLGRPAEHILEISSKSLIPPHLAPTKFSERRPTLPNSVLTVYVPGTQSWR